MNIRIAVANTDTEYARRFFDCLADDARFTVSLFTDPAALRDALRQKKYDILLLDAEMLAQDTKTATVSILLVDEEETDEAVRRSPLPKINKYQRISEILRHALDIYADCSKSGVAFGEKAMKIAAVFSPIGGSGVTTLAAALTMAYVKAGKHAVYLGLEEFPSAAAIFGNEGGKGLSEVFAKLDSDINFNAKLQSLLHTADGVGYFNSFDSLRDLAELTVEEIARFLDLLAQSGLCDLVVVDLDSTLSEVNRAVMEHADVILIPATEGTLSAYKLDTLLDQMSFMDAFGGKLRLIGNRNARINNTHGLHPALCIPAVSSAVPREICKYIVNNGNLPVSELL